MDLLYKSQKAVFLLYRRRLGLSSSLIFYFIMGIIVVYMLYLVWLYTYFSRFYSESVAQDKFIKFYMV